MSLSEIIMRTKARKAMERLAKLDPEILGTINILVDRYIYDWIERNQERLKGPKGDTIVGPPGPEVNYSEEELRRILAPIIPPPIKGDDGYTPIKGKDYFDGEKGKDGKSIVGEPGKDGLPGKDGSPDRPNEIIEKINKAKEKINLSMVRGLIEELKEIKQAIRERVKGGGGGGGGSGNWVPEVPAGAVNDVNVTFTLTSNVASGGKASFVLLNGQVQRYTTHYTIAGKTITFTTAPETGDSVFVIYQR